MLHAAARRRPRRTRDGAELPRMDYRTIGARRFRGLVEALEAELGSDLSEPDRALIAQAAAVQIQCEQLQRAIVEGRDVDGDMLVRLSSEHRRLLVSLRAKAAKTKPSGATALQEYLASKAAQAADAPEGTQDP